MYPEIIFLYRSTFFRQRPVINKVFCLLDDRFGSALDSCVVYFYRVAANILKGVWLSI